MLFKTHARATKRKKNEMNEVIIIIINLFYDTNTTYKAVFTETYSNEQGERDVR